MVPINYKIIELNNNINNLKYIYVVNISMCAWVRENQLPYIDYICYKVLKYDFLCINKKGILMSYGYASN